MEKVRSQAMGTHFLTAPMRLSVKVAELAKSFGVSTETIRKDLNLLQKQGIAEVSHGGALANLDYIERPLRYRQTMNLKDKNAIAMKALEYIPPDGVIFLDAGSTVLCLATLLNLRSGYTIITNSLGSINALVGSKNILHMIGGNLNETTMSFGGFGATTLLSKIKADIAFMGSRGFLQHNGPTTVDFLDAETKRIMVTNSTKPIVLAESGKAISSSLVEYTNWKNIDLLITDDKMKNKKQGELSRAVDIVLAESLDK